MADTMTSIEQEQVILRAWSERSAERLSALREARNLAIDQWIVELKMLTSEIDPTGCNRIAVAGRLADARFIGREAMYQALQVLAPHAAKYRPQIAQLDGMLIRPKPSTDQKVAQACRESISMLRHGLKSWGMPLKKGR